MINYSELKSLYYKWLSNSALNLIFGADILML